MGDGCSSCASLQAQVARLQAQVARLQRENERLRRHIERLRRVIRMARATCQKWIVQTREVLSQKSGMPRGLWAFARGAHEVARRLLGILNQGEE